MFPDPSFRVSAVSDLNSMNKHESHLFSIDYISISGHEPDIMLQHAPSSRKPSQIKVWLSDLQVGARATADVVGTSWITWFHQNPTNQM